jgi:hypothetical protein
MTQTTESPGFPGRFMEMTLVSYPPIGYHGDFPICERVQLISFSID